MAVSCSNCGGSHPVWDCRSKSESGRKTDADRPLGGLPPKSAYNDKSGRSQTKSTGGRGGSLAPPDGSKPNPYVCADTPPVDTKGEVAAVAPSGPHVGSTSPAKFDKKAWSREYMSEYMKKYRADVKAGTRIPKRKGEK